MEILSQDDIDDLFSAIGTENYFSIESITDMSDYFTFITSFRQISENFDIYFLFKFLSCHVFFPKCIVKSVIIGVNIFLIVFL
jgi:hypothetical protein